jgi:DNA modification methylase
MTYLRAIIRGRNNRPYAEDGAGHDWYRFVLSFPPHLIRSYVERFELTSSDRVLDPFCGTGTTVVECKKLGIGAVGIEANPMAHFATETKADWSPDPDGLISHASEVGERTLAKLYSQGIEDTGSHLPLFSHLDSSEGTLPQARLVLKPEMQKLLLRDSISPLPLHKTLALLETLSEHRDLRYDRHERLALAKALVQTIGNLHFGPEVGVGPVKPDAPVVSPWLEGVRAICNDLRELRRLKGAPSTVHLADARCISEVVEGESVDAVITSPPYPNEKDYTRTMRLESVILGFITSKEDLRSLKDGLLRSNTRNVYKRDDDDTWVLNNPAIRDIASAIESRRIELGKTSGFERLYSRVTKLYFGGMARHLAGLRQVLKPGAQLAYVVGDQASYLQVMIRTGRLLASIAESLGYELVDTDLFRSRMATATREHLREEAILLRWPGVKQKRLSAAKGLSVRGGTMNNSGEIAIGTANRYERIIERVFLSNYREGLREIPFSRQEIEQVATELNINLPKNLGDVVYSFRYRVPLPDAIRERAPEGEEWVIRPAGRAMYCFALVSQQNISPATMLAEIKVPDSTPGLVTLYALSDEQSLLAKLRYNRLIDVFTGITCYSLQNHVRTFVAGVGQLETNEIYVGIDKRGIHYVFPVQAKGVDGKLNVVQIEQNIALCAAKFPSLVCRPVGAQSIDADSVALFEFESGQDGVKISEEKHYRLVSPDQVTPELLRSYRKHLPA